MAVDGGSLVVRVSDDGRGFAEDPAAPGDWPRYGLQAMRERAQAIGATVEWSSSPGRGRDGDRDGAGGRRPVRRGARRRHAGGG